MSHESLGCFINDVCPGAYSPVIPVDYGFLDEFNVNPLGIYGSRSKIVEYLVDKGALSHGVYVCEPFFFPPRG